jgi:hypothetical protein
MVYPSKAAASLISRKAEESTMFLDEEYSRLVHEV